MTELPLQSMNWHPLILSFLLIAQKVWVDNYLCNSNLTFNYPIQNLDVKDEVADPLVEVGAKAWRRPNAAKFTADKELGWPLKISTHKTG